MTGVVALAIQNVSMGDDDDGVAWWDKIPHEVKDRNLVIIYHVDPKTTDDGGIPIAGSRTARYVKIPLPYGLNWFATIANQAYDVARNAEDKARGSSPAKAAARVASSFLAAYLPAQELARSLENSESLAAAVAPDLINAPIQAGINLNAFGRRMYPDSEYNKNLPDSTKYFPSHAGTIFQRAAEGLNRIGGGNEFEPASGLRGLGGLMDMTPATIETLTRAYGGGPASFIIDIWNAAYVRQEIERPDWDIKRLPFVKQTRGIVDAETDRMLAYQRMDQVDEVVDRIKKAQKVGNDEAAKRMKDENLPMYRLAGALEITREKLDKLRDEEMSLIAGDKSESEKYAKIVELNHKRRRVLQDMNKAFNASMRAAEKPPQ
jgi:hypothetical protein